MNVLFSNIISSKDLHFGLVLQPGNWSEPHDVGTTQHTHTLLLLLLQNQARALAAHGLSSLFPSLVIAIQIDIDLMLSRHHQQQQQQIQRPRSRLLFGFVFEGGGGALPHLKSLQVSAAQRCRVVIPTLRSAVDAASRALRQRMTAGVLNAARTPRSERIPLRIHRCVTIVVHSL